MRHKKTTFRVIKPPNVSSHTIAAFFCAFAYFYVGMRNAEYNTPSGGIRVRALRWLNLSPGSTSNRGHLIKLNTEKMKTENGVAVPKNRQYQILLNSSEVRLLNFLIGFFSDRSFMTPEVALALGTLHQKASVTKKRMPLREQNGYTTSYVNTNNNNLTLR